MISKGFIFDPYVVEASATTDARSAYRALASAAASYLGEMDAAVANNTLPPRVAMHTRVRGTGPGVAFGHLIELIQTGLHLDWQSPFEGSNNVSGVELPARVVLGEDRDDGFLFLRFAANTQDLTLHIHPLSDRFIYVIGGRGFFHVTDSPLHDLLCAKFQHIPARDRDAFMFRKNTVHTFSTAAHPLLLLSYHRPFVPLLDADQYETTEPALLPKDFLRGVQGNVSFDAAWTLCL